MGTSDPHPESLRISRIPAMQDATMLLALTGWMDGGAVSTGTVRSIMERRALEEIATIRPDPFYIYNFPGTMEVTALFRPTVIVRRGVIREFDLPINLFLADAANNIVFFVGKEPNLRWEEFAGCIFAVAHRAKVRRIIFMGSFGGSVPHTREPRMYGSVSDKSAREQLLSYGVRLSDYKGPASFSTYLLSQAPLEQIQMISLVAEIPGYLQGVNPASIEAVTKRLSKMLNISVDFDTMRKTTSAWEEQVTEAVQQDEELAATVHKLEEAYDNELLEEQDSR